jgi:phage gp36-like protein
LSKRRDLTEEEKIQIEVIIMNTPISEIPDEYKQLFCSIRDYYLRDKRLSDAQIEIMKKTKTFVDKYKTKKPQDVSEDVEQMLNRKFNRI